MRGRSFSRYQNMHRVAIVDPRSNAAAVFPPICPKRPMNTNSNSELSRKKFRPPGGGKGQDLLALSQPAP